MGRRSVSLLLLGALLLVLAPASVSARCTETKIQDDCCCPEMKDRGHCDSPSRRIEQPRSCCGPVNPPALPATGTPMDQPQAKKAGTGHATSSFEASLPGPATPLTSSNRQDAGPPAVPLFKLHASLLI